MTNFQSSMAVAPRTRSLAVNPGMGAYGDTSAIAAVPAAERVAIDALSTRVGFKAGRPPRGVPR